MIDSAQADRLARAMARLVASAEAYSGYCFRCVKPQYSSRLDAFSGAGSRKASGRFHVKGRFNLVYTSTTLEAAQWEYLNTARSIGTDTAYLLPLTAIGADVVLSKVLNLSSAATRNILKITLKQLRETNWSSSSQETLTQLLGRLAFEAGFEAMLVPSAGGGQNLNIFRQNLLSGSSLQIINEGELPIP